MHPCKFNFKQEQQGADPRPSLAVFNKIKPNFSIKILVWFHIFTERPRSDDLPCLIIEPEVNYPFN